MQPCWRGRGCSVISMPTAAGAPSTTTTWWARRHSWKPWSWRSSCDERATATTASASASTSIRTPKMRSRLCAGACCSRGSSTPRPGWSEQDPEDWWRATQVALEAVAAAGVKDVRGIGLSGQMHGLVCLDDHDRVLRPAMLWNDQRTGAECAEIEARIGLERLI